MAEKKSDSAKAAEAAEAAAEESARRAAGQVNGGGPWPPELLLERYVGATRARGQIGEYTSHEG